MRHPRLLEAICLWFAIALIFGGLGALDLWDPDEANYAEIAREMAASGDWVVPHSNFRPYLEKPPLAFWIAALAMRAAGTGEAAARLPAALGGVALLITAAAWARRWSPHGAAAAALLALGSCLGFLVTARLGILDMPLTACTMLAMFGFERRVLSGGGRAGWWCLWGGMAAGLLAKGPVALALPLGCGALAAAWLRPPQWLSRLDPLRGILLLILLAGPWFLSLELRHPGSLRGFIIEHHWLRFAGQGIEHRQPLPRWSYLALLAAAGLPGSLLWPASIASGWRRARQGEPSSALLLAAAFLPLALFTVSATRLPQYVLPSLPPLCLLAAREVAERRRWRLLIALAAAGAALFLMLERSVAAPLNERRSERPLALEAGRRAPLGESLLSYRLGRPYASVFYSRRRVRFIEEEVTFDQFVSSSRRFWILLDEPERAALERRHRRAFPPLAAHAGRCLITSRPAP